jgi:hypothetical protein
MTEEAKPLALYHGEVEHALARFGEREVVQALAVRIQVTDTSKIPLNKIEALVVAQAALTHRLDPFPPNRELWFWVQKKGDKRELTIMRARDGSLKVANDNMRRAGTYMLPPRFLFLRDEARRAELQVPERAMAKIAEVEDYASTQMWQDRYNAMKDAGAKHAEIIELIGAPPKLEGLGIVTEEEIEQAEWWHDSQGKRTGRKDVHYNHVERCEKRALLAALRTRWLFESDEDVQNTLASSVTDDYIIDADWYLKPEPVVAEGEELRKKADAGAEALFGGRQGEPEVDRGKPGYWPREVLKTLVEENLASNDFHAAGMLKFSAFDRSVSIGPARIYAKAYTGFRDQDVPSKEAGEQAMGVYLKSLKGGADGPA